MKRRAFAAVLALFLMIPMLAAVVSADCGPKPSTTMTVCYLRWLREGESAARTAGYTICANAASVLIGFLLLA